MTKQHFMRNTEWLRDFPKHPAADNPDAANTCVNPMFHDGRQHIFIQVLALSLSGANDVHMIHSQHTGCLVSTHLLLISLTAPFLCECPPSAVSV